MDSSSSTKLSFHVATPLVLANAVDVSRFSNWMRYTFDKCDNPLTPLLDCKVYAACGNMRLPLNRKPAEPGSSVDKPCLRPVSRIGSLKFADTHDDATPDAPHGHTLELLLKPDSIAPPHQAQPPGALVFTRCRSGPTHVQQRGSRASARRSPRGARSCCARRAALPPIAAHRTARHSPCHRGPALPSMRRAGWARVCE